MRPVPEQFFEKVKRQWGIRDQPGLSLLALAAKCLGEIQQCEAIIRDKVPS